MSLNKTNMKKTTVILSFLAALWAVSNAGAATLSPTSNVDDSGINAYAFVDESNTPLAVDTATVRIGTCSLTDQQVQDNFASGNLAAIDAAWETFDDSFAMGQGLDFAGAFQTSLSESTISNFGGETVYVWVVTGTDFTSDSEAHFFASTTQTFPTDISGQPAQTGQILVRPSTMDSIIKGGDSLSVIPTDCGPIGVLVCYDCEFPETARYLADQGAEIIFVPYCTDDRPAYQRVRVCAQARAIENQVYVVTSGVIGNLPSVQAMDIHYGRAGVFTPNDFEFARDGIQAEADSNVEMLLVADLDINDLYRSRASGSVRQRLDRRGDLFEFKTNFGDTLNDLEEQEDNPLQIRIPAEESEE